MKKLSKAIPSSAALATLLLWTTAIHAQVVQVTVRIDDPAISVGGSTRVRVFAQVAADRRATTDRIFSWYLDLLSSSSSIVALDYGALQRTASDRDPRTSSSGSPDGANLHGVFDTFINRSGAGVNEAVELFSIPITGLAAGRVVFRVQAGTGVPGLAADFIVAPKNGGDPLLGGIYEGATAALDVTGEFSPCSVALKGVREQISAGQSRITLTFTPCAGRNHFVEFRESLYSGPWIPMPNGPHNSGTITDAVSTGSRSYRVRIEGVGNQPGPCAPSLLVAGQRLPGGQNQVTLSFSPCAGREHVVEFRDSLLTGAWAPLPEGPHNTGSLTDLSSAPRRFYRLRIQ